MKSKVAMMCLALASASFAVDEYLPIEAGKTEIDIGIAPIFPEVSDQTTGIPLQVKYGVMPGLDIEVATTYVLNGSLTGLVQPEVAAKYALGATGVAVYGNVALPFAVGDFADVYAGLSIAPGVVYGKNFDKIQAVAKASYTIFFEDEGFTPDNSLDILLKPGYMIDDKLAAYVGLAYGMAGDFSETVLMPGVTYTLSKNVAFEANVPIAVASDFEKYWGIQAYLYYTL